MGKKYGNYYLQYLFDDLHVIYMFFTYYVNFQLFQWISFTYEAFVCLEKQTAFNFPLE